MEKTFILGLGAQKAGTTWLYSFLSKSGKMAKPGKGEANPKEYHIWDHKRAGRHRTLKLRDGLVLSRENYAQYFNLLLEDNVGKFATDISPSYSFTTQNDLMQLKQSFQQFDIQIKPVFLMRDPISRIHSHLSMLRNRKVQYTYLKLDLTELDDNKVISGFSKLPIAKKRTSYHETLPRIDNVFGLENCYIGFYETMFSSDQIDALADYTGIPAEHSHAAFNPNPSVYETELSRHIKQQIVKEYKLTYTYCLEKFPHLEQVWEGYKYL